MVKENDSMNELMKAVGKADASFSITLEADYTRMFNYVYGKDIDINDDYLIINDRNFTFELQLSKYSCVKEGVEFLLCGDGLHIYIEEI